MKLLIDGVRGIKEKKITRVATDFGLYDMVDDSGIYGFKKLCKKKN